MQQSLAVRMRPQTLDDIVGQDEAIGNGTIFNNMIKDDKLKSIMLYGPPGTGKTTIAEVVSRTTNAEFHKINAVSSGKKDIEEVCKIGQKNVANGKRTVLFIDEIHRFNKAQQDYLLPFVENDIVILIGATTENPFFEVNGALMSRCYLVKLSPVKPEDIKTVVLRALNDTINGLGQYGQTIDDDALTLIAIQCNGDVRYALQLLELASLSAYGKDKIVITDVQAVIQKPHLTYDKDGDKHYDTISAFIKSMRGSDPDATLYYLARMIEAGEDPKFIARRILVHASEDVGMADPNAIVIAAAAVDAVNFIGLPEARINLAHAALYIALAPKSNSVVKGIDKALEYVHNNPSDDVPPAMRDNHYKSAYKLGHGVGYEYPHDYPNHWVKQQYLPDGVNETFYESDNMGYQKSVDNFMDIIKN